MKDTQPLIIHHHPCADGFGSAFAAWKKFGDEAEYVGLNYPRFNKADPLELAWEKFITAIPSGVVTGRDVFILDFSLPHPVMVKLIHEARHVTWLDHHESAFVDWCGADYLTERRQTFHQETFGFGKDLKDCRIVLDNNRSGALIAWDHFHPSTPTPHLFYLLDDYDRFVFNLPETRAFNRTLWSHFPWTFEQWDSEIPDPSGSPKEFEAYIHDGAILVKAHDGQVEGVVKATAMACAIAVPRAQPDEGLGVTYGQEVVRGLASNAPKFMASDIGHRLAKESGTFGLIWSVRADGLVQCDLRSEKGNGCNVAELAAKFGGGGHRSAAGFVTTMEVLQSWLTLSKTR